MYKKNNTISGLNDYIYINEYIYTNRKGKRKFQELSLKGEVLWQSEENEVYHYYVNDDIIIFNKYNDNEEFIFDDTMIYNRKTKKTVFNGKIPLFLYQYQCFYENIFYNIDVESIIVFDVLKGVVLEKKEIKTEGVTSLLTDNFLIKNRDSHIYVYIKTDFSLLWQKDLNDYFLKDTETEVEVKEVYLYENSLIVVTKAGVVRLNIETGELIWKTNYYARTMEIVGHFGYVCTSLSLYRINLDNGETYHYGREYAQLPDFEYEGKSYWASGHRVVYHDGLLWYLVYDSGDSFVIAIDPESAEYQWIHKIDTYEKADEIQFHQDKMFISDTGGNLFIYEEIK